MRPVFFILINLICLSMLGGQEPLVSTHNFEIKGIYGIQRPFYSVNGPLDLLLLSRDTRWRSRIGLGVCYFVFKKWHAGLNTFYSQEGGGYENQFTNASYWKNSFLVGFNSNYKKKVIFELNTGVDLNLLLAARLKNKVSHANENVTGYFKPWSISFPIETGLKTRISGRTYVGLHFLLEIGGSQVDSESFIKVAQYDFPVFQVCLSRVLK